MTSSPSPTSRSGLSTPKVNNSPGSRSPNGVDDRYGCGSTAHTHGQGTRNARRYGAAHRRSCALCNRIHQEIVSKPTAAVGDAHLDDDGDVVMADVSLENSLVEVAHRDEDGDVVMEDA